MGTVTDYLATVDAARRPALERVVARAHDLVPGLVEGTAYGMPVLLHRGKPLLSAVEAKAHLALYPHSGVIVDLVAADLDGFSLSKGTIRFQADQPIPDAVLDRVITLRRQHIDEALDTPRPKRARGNA
ncbi:MAG: DUF1801 domain-containing protein [Actinomycetales bacterium]|uniref:DUF1801 domain-containing protein n=1 Tax=Candidatus Phosphoribacter hodrii TaxID=2953743 RepID=A0A9D7T7C4_9MICO|nr:DUF1801 domain-containing protein [Candidatus Phosphoribacter hodrii]